jgi:hypothetical protein
MAFAACIFDFQDTPPLPLNSERSFSDVTYKKLMPRPNMFILTVSGLGRTGECKHYGEKTRELFTGTNVTSFHASQIYSYCSRTVQHPPDLISGEHHGDFCTGGYVFDSQTYALNK